MSARLAYAGALLGSMVLSLSQCDAPEPQPKPAPKAPSSYAYQVRLNLSVRAAKAIKAAKDRIDVTALYYGDPRPGHRFATDSLNRIELGDEEAGAAADSHVVSMTGEFDTAKLSQIRGEPQLLISVFSTDPVGNPDTVLACHSWIGLMSEVRHTPPVIDCDLASGDAA